MGDFHQYLKENYACIEFADVGDEENGKEDRITSKLSIADLLPEEAMCKSTFSRILLEYMQTIATKMKSEVVTTAQFIDQNHPNAV
ncbi:unnamed protein product [Anisakis simplex]|uniref:Uncharacterized protein n=1 Tax=Anisakis simplex TaxID=6269 RepID=A0A0M3JD42_ANISI|nr:unnamed protein product [Anisakis simplex]